MVEISLSGSGEGPRKETTGAYSIFSVHAGISGQRWLERGEAPGDGDDRSLRSSI
jgi:hypothetical protein